MGLVDGNHVYLRCKYPLDQREHAATSTTTVENVHKKKNSMMIQIENDAR